MANDKKRRLGRGLDALIPKEPEQKPTSGVEEIPVSEIIPNPRQPRQVIYAEQLSELAASIKEHGILQPLVVTRASSEGGGKYYLVAGERRWRAAQMAGLKKVPVVIRDISPREMLEWALVENIQREDLNPLEEARAYWTLVEEFGMTQEQVAKRVGKSRSAVANVIRLLNLPDFVQKALAGGKISEGHARALLPLQEKQQKELLDLIIDKGLSVRQTESLVRRIQEAARKQQSEEQEEPNFDAELARLAEKMQASLGTKVELLKGKKGGKVVIYYYSDEELEHIYSRLTGEG